MPFVEKLLGKSDEFDVEHFLNNLDSEDVSEYDDADALVKPVSLQSSEDLDMICAELRKGNIMLVNIADLSKRNALKLREFVEGIRATVDEINGDIARVSHDRIIATPCKVKIVKRKD
jgi:uncharacterized protein